MTGDFIFGFFVGAVTMLVTGFVIIAYLNRKSLLENDNFRGDQWP